VLDEERCRRLVRLAQSGDGDDHAASGGGPRAEDPSRTPRGGAGRTSTRPVTVGCGPRSRAPPHRRRGRSAVPWDKAARERHPPTAPTRKELT